MSCTKQMRTPKAQKSQMLPNVVTTEEESLVVVKKLLAIAVSSITYLRGLFPPNAYGSKYVEGQKVMILRESDSCAGANQIVKWMRGCFDALERKYLRNIALSIYTDPENPKKVTEWYQFKIQYTANGPQMDFESNNKVPSTACSNTRKATILLVRKLYILMQHLEPLPQVYLSMKLSYYNEVTPQDYQPPGFQEADSDIVEFEKDPAMLTMGEVVTPFHTLKVDVTTERHRLEQVGEEVEKEEEAVCVKDKWFLRMEEEVSVRQANMEQSYVIEDVEKTDSENSQLDNSEVQLTCHEKMEGCEETTRSPLVKSPSSVEMSVKRTRSGRVIGATTEIKPAEEVNKITEKPSPTQDTMLFRYDFPSSQDSESASVIKRCKFSEPKERY